MQFRSQTYYITLMTRNTIRVQIFINFIGYKELEC